MISGSGHDSYVSMLVVVVGVLIINNLNKIVRNTIRETYVIDNLGIPRVEVPTYYNTIFFIFKNKIRSQYLRLEDFANIKGFTILVISTFIVENTKYCSEIVVTDLTIVTALKTFRGSAPLTPDQRSP